MKLLTFFFKYFERQENIVTLSSFFIPLSNMIHIRLLMYEIFFNNKLVLIPIKQCEHCTAVDPVEKSPG